VDHRRVGAPGHRQSAVQRGHLRTRPPADNHHHTRNPPGDDYIARRIAELLTPGTSPRSDADRRAIAHDANHPARPRLSLVNDAVVDDAAEPDGDHTDEDETTGTTPEEIATGKRPAPG